MATGLRENLPPGCHLGVTQDGRVFFVNDIQKTTSWLHPVTRQPILTGLQYNPDLPPGWEQDITNEGRVYFVDHNRGLTTFDHPVYGPSDPGASSVPRSPTTQQSQDLTHGDTFKRGDLKQRSVKAPTAKRNPNSEVVKRGWLYRLESSGISKLWKRRWCVLADFALFIYKSDDEAVTLTSILLPSYRINPCTEADNIKRNFVFKVEHENTKTLYFASDQQPDCEAWMAYLRQAAMMNGGAGFHREPNNNMRQYPANKFPQDSTHGDPNRHPKDPQYQMERPPGFENNSSMNQNVGHPKQTSSYRKYGDPAASPLATPTDRNFPRGYDNPIYSSNASVQQPGQGFPGRDGVNYNSLSNQPNRGSQVYPPVSRDNLFNPNQSHTSATFPENSGSFSVNPRPQPYPRQQKVLRDGFASDSARNSVAHSDSTRSGHSFQHAQADRQKQLQQQPGHRPDLQHQRDDTVRDSYSDSDDNRMKHLNRWDQNFPSIDEEHLKHSSFDDLLDGRKGKNPGQTSTFNTRSKSQENFSRAPSSRQQPPQEQPRPGGSYPEQNLGGSLSNNIQPHPRNVGQQLPGDRQHQGPQDGPSYQRPKTDNTAREISLRSPASSRGSSHHSAPYQPQREFQRVVQQSPGDWDTGGSLRDNREPRRQQDLQQQGTSHTLNSSVGSSRSPGSHSFSSNQPLQQQQPHDSRQHLQQDLQKQPSQGSLPRPHQVSLPRPHQAPQHGRPELHISLNNQPQDPRSYPNQNSPHIYMNLPSRNAQSQVSPSDSQNSSSSQLPARPPYPSSARQEMVEEMAQSKTPSTQRDFLTSNQLNTQRMQQPTYFQYPSPRNQQKNQNSLERSKGNLHQQLVQSSQNQPNSRLSGASRTSQSSRSDRKDGSQPLQDSFSRTNMMDPEAQKLRFAYERVHSLRMTPDKAPSRRQPLQIQTVKEDPNMSDREILETNLEKVAKKNPLNVPRLRMSISAGDLIGKTHDELVLLLIQLRRNQAGLEKARDIHRSQTEKRRPAELEYRRQMHQFGKVQDKYLLDQHQMYVEAKGHMQEIENKLEVYKPIINLLDNMVTMGSLYGGDNLMLATQYRKHLLRPDQYQPPKKMLEFSRKQQEERLIQKTEEEIKQLSSDEVDLEGKIDRLNELDRRLQEQSVRVSSFREDKELMEKALNGVLKQQDMSRNDPREMARLSQQQQTLEREISRIIQQLAEASKELEETTVENSKLEYEVALLRNKVHGELPRSRSVPSLSSENVRTKMKMEKEVAKVEGIIQGLSKEGARLSEAMSTLRRSSSSSQLASALDKEDGKKKGGTYLQTDLDSGDQVDLASTREKALSEGYNSRPAISHQRQNASAPEEWDVENADENTKRFFGLVPKEKPKTLTVRDVKRQAEQRKEREKVKRDDDDDDYTGGEEIKLRVSDVDSEASSIIHARIPSDGSGKVPVPGQWETGHPLYENLRYSATAVPEVHSAPGSRRSSLILMAPKPFTPYQDRTSRPFRSELELTSSGEPQFDAGRHPVTSGLDRQYRSAEILNSPLEGGRKLASNNQEEKPYINGGLSGTQGENNPYQNDYPRNSFGSQSQILSGQSQFKPLSVHTRSQSDISANSGFSDALKDSQVRAIYEQPTSESNSWLNQDTDPPASAFHITRPVNFLRAYTARPWTKPSMEPSGHLFDVKKSPKGRYLTISSSEPLKLEQNTLLNQTLHSTAGDLILSRPIDNVPDIIKSSQTRVDQIDDKTIDREILYVPEKVFIPERYDPEADAEHLTEEEKLRRREKAERIKKLLASQSVLSMSQTDISQVADNVHTRVQNEQRERTHFLTLNQELARQVTLQSKKQAAERRKTWSGAQFAAAKKQYEQELTG